MTRSAGPTSESDPLEPPVEPVESVESHRHRAIRSFTLRRGRSTSAQQRAFEQWLPTFGIPYAPSALNLPQAFGRTAPTVLEIGCGMGDATVAIARQRPDVDFLAVEVFAAGVGALLKSINDGQLTNIRIVHHDAVEVVRDMMALNSLAGVHVYFPDPWPKKRHHKRRLLQQPFVHLLASRIAPTGYLHCATDWEDYASQMFQVLSDEPQLMNLHPGNAATPGNPLCTRPVTKFHARGERLGHATCDFVFARRTQV